MDDAEEIRSAFANAVQLATDQLSSIRKSAVWRPIAPEDQAWLTEQELADAGRPLDALVRDVCDRVMAYPMGNGHPRFFGWVNSPPAPAGVLVEPLAAALNPSCAGGEHAAVLLEHTVVRWLADLVGYPYSSNGGLLTSGASMATIICLAAARQEATARNGWDVRVDGLTGMPPLATYASAEAHSCVRKAVELLGLGNRYVRTIPVDDRFRMDTDALRAAIAEDRATGVQPFVIVATAGTVNTGAVDPLGDIADVAAENELWLHIDGAYGAFGVLADSPATEYAGLARASSLALDPHKWLGVPVDCGCALFRDPTVTRATFSLVPPYLRDDSSDDGGWFSEYGLEQTRPFRALRVWATMSHLGRAGIRQLVNDTRACALTLARMIAQSPDFELLAPVTTSIVAFRYVPRDASARNYFLDDLNRRIPPLVQERGKAFLTGTRLGSIEALRACVLNARTTVDDLAHLLQEIRSVAATIDHVPTA